MVEPLSVNTDGVRSLGDIHTGVAAGLGSLSAGTPGSADVAMSHGTIADGVTTALTAALGSRAKSLNATQTSAETISELLRQAALAYERGDRRGGAAIEAAAGVIAARQSSAACQTGAGASTPTATDAIGQVAGQLGQLGQQLAAPFAALAQPLQQLPQQLMQGAQQMMRPPTPPTEKTPGPEPETGPQPDDRDRDEDITMRDLSDEDPAGSADSEDSGAMPGDQPGSGTAPLAPADRPRPAPTRPAIS